jgi:twitching motility protein PilT
MGTILIDRLLAECVRQGASELYITPNEAPMLRNDGLLRAHDSKLLRPTDTYLFMQCITPYRYQQEFHATGRAEFEFGFGSEARFRVSIIRKTGQVAMVLRQCPSPVWQMGVKVQG